MPDRATRAGVTVDLSENVAEDIRQREEKLRAGERKRTDLADLWRDEVRDEKDDDEERKTEVVVLETMLFSESGEEGGRSHVAL